MIVLILTDFDVRDARDFLSYVAYVRAPYYQYSSTLRGIIQRGLLRPSGRNGRAVKSGEVGEKEEERRESKSRVKWEGEKGCRQRGVDFYRLHGTSRPNGELAEHRMIGSFPIVAHNQQYTPEHSRFQICRHGQLRLSICTQRGARPRERMHTHTHTCENEGALQRRIWLRFAAMKLVICCTGTADVPFIDRGATTLFELFGWLMHSNQWLVEKKDSNKARC